MKKLVIFIAALFLLSFPLYSYTESEFNDLWPLSDPIGTGAYIVLVDGIIQADVDIDWFDYLANMQNNMTVTIVWASSPGLSVNVFLRQAPGDQPGVLIATLVWGINNSITFPALISDRHYIEVFSQYYIPQVQYQIMIQNANEPTLPVTLSGFSAIQSGEFVGLQWITQTETGMSGYNVFRSETSDLDAAIKINPTIIPATNTSTTQTYSYLDNEVYLGDDYYYWLQAVEIDGTSNVYGSVLVETQVPPDDPGVPEITPQTRLLGSYPNPFSSNTTLRFDLAEKSDVSLDIFNVRGQRIQTIVSGELDNGSYRYVWDGKNEMGESVASGLYIVRLQTDGNVHFSRLTVKN